MATYGWMINLSGKSIPVYSPGGAGPSTIQIGNLTANECFVDGTISENPWEGDGIPVVFLNSNHSIKRYRREAERRSKEKTSALSV